MCALRLWLQASAPSAGSCMCPRIPNDPHHRGDAYDGRTHDLPDKEAALKELQNFLGPAFYVFIEDPDDVTHADPDKSNEHFHCQVRRGTVYPPLSPDSAIDEADA